MEHPTNEKLHDLYFGNLSDEETIAIESHLSECRICEDHFESLLRSWVKNSPSNESSNSYVGEIYIAKIDKKLICNICGHDQFEQRSILMNTRLMSFIGLDWLNRESKGYVCQQCVYVHWFA